MKFALIAAIAILAGCESYRDILRQQKIHPKKSSAQGGVHSTLSHPSEWKWSTAELSAKTEGKQSHCGSCGPTSECPAKK